METETAQHIMRAVEPTQQIAIVNSSHVLSDAQVVAAIPALQTQIDRDFLPAWKLPPVKLVFAVLGKVPKGAWPIYLNRHSTDEGALGWHTDEGGQIYGRVFVGDCIRYGVAWTADLSHEILETILDPTANKTFKMTGNRQAALEACDACEADAYGYKIGDFLVSDFVLPTYFSNNPQTKGTLYDHTGVLKGPCPTLSAGGYMSIYNPGQGWTNIEMDRYDGMRSRRALMVRYRSEWRKSRHPTGE